MKSLLKSITASAAFFTFGSTAIGHLGNGWLGAHDEVDKGLMLPTHDDEDKVFGDLMPQTLRLKLARCFPDATLKFMRLIGANGDGEIKGAKALLRFSDQAEKYSLGDNTLCLIGKPVWNIEGKLGKGADQLIAVSESTLGYSDQFTTKYNIANFSSKLSDTSDDKIVSDASCFGEVLEKLAQCLGMDICYLEVNSSRPLSKRILKQVGRFKDYFSRFYWVKYNGRDDNIPNPCKYELLIDDSDKLKDEGITQCIKEMFAQNLESLGDELKNRKLLKFEDEHSIFIQFIKDGKNPQRITLGSDRGREDPFSSIRSEKILKEVLFIVADVDHNEVYLIFEDNSGYIEKSKQGEEEEEEWVEEEDVIEEKSEEEEWFEEESVKEEKREEEVSEKRETVKDFPPPFPFPFPDHNYDPSTFDFEKIPHKEKALPVFFVPTDLEFGEYPYWTNYIENLEEDDYEESSGDDEKDNKKRKRDDKKENHDIDISPWTEWVKDKFVPPTCPTHAYGGEPDIIDL